MDGFCRSEGYLVGSGFGVTVLQTDLTTEKERRKKEGTVTSWSERQGAKTRGHAATARYIFRGDHSLRKEENGYVQNTIINYVP